MKKKPILTAICFAVGLLLLAMMLGAKKPPKMTEEQRYRNYVRVQQEVYPWKTEADLRRQWQGGKVIQSWFTWWAKGGWREGAEPQAKHPVPGSIVGPSPSYFNPGRAGRLTSEASDRLKMQEIMRDGREDCRRANIWLRKGSGAGGNSREPKKAGDTCKLKVER